MPIWVDVISRLDERAAAATARQIDQTFSDAGVRVGRSTGSAITTEIDRATRTAGSRLTSDFVVHGTTAGQGFGRSFNASVERSTAASGGFSSAVSGYSAAASRAGAVAGKALGVAFTAAAGGVIGIAGTALFKGFERYKSIDATAKRLGAMGNNAQQVAAIMSDINAVVVGTPIALDAAAASATQFLAGGVRQGRPLRDALTAIADAAGASGQRFEDLATVFGQVFNKGKLQAEEMVQLNERGINVQAALRDAFGLTADELTKMTANGQVSFDMLVYAIEGKFGGMSKKMGDSIDGAMSNMNAAVAKVGANLISAAFGDPLSTTEGPGAMAEAINKVTKRLTEVNAWITGHQGEIRKMFEDGVKAAEDIGGAIRDVIGFLDDMGVGIGDVVVAFGAWKAIEGVSSLITSLGAIKTTLGVELPAAAATGAAGIVSAFSKIVLPAWLAYMIGKENPVMNNQGVKDAVHAARNGDPSKLQNQFYNIDAEMRGQKPPEFNIPGPSKENIAARRQGLPGGPPLPPPPPPPALDDGPMSKPSPLAPSAAAGGHGGGPKLPDAPVLPLQYSNTAGMSSAVANAVTRLDDARHEVAEKQARVNQLERSNVASADEIQKARNDLAKAQQDQLKAEQSLTDARTKATERGTKQLGKLSSDLDDMGASLDKDFGISKGLSGIVENAVKALGNILAAPFLQALGFVSKANPNEGSGLVGVAAANGAFGAQYTPAALAAQGGGVLAYPGVGMSGYSGGAHPGDAALLANVRPGSYSQDASRDLLKGLSDCSSSVGDLVTILDTGRTSGDKLTTGNAASWLPQHGFVPGMGGPGDFRVAYNPDHMQATLPGGTPWNWGSPAAAARGGVGGTGADDPSLTTHYYRPGGAGAQAFSVPSVPVVSAAVAPSAIGPAALQPGPTADLYSPENTNPALNNPTPTGGGAGQFPQAAPFGLNARLGAAGIGGAPQPPAIGPGSAYPSQGGNSGNFFGGMAMDGLMGAAGAADLMFPGAGSLAKIGIQVANRTIGYGAQNLGILASAVGETLSVGDNPKGSIGAGWIGKLAGGLAGAAPALPNLAGGQKKPLPADAQGGGQGNTTTVGDTNITVNNNGATENQNGRTIAEHQAAMYAPAGRQ